MFETITEPVQIPWKQARTMLGGHFKELVLPTDRIQKDKQDRS